MDDTSKRNDLIAMEMKCIRIPFMELFFVFFGSFHFSSAVTVEICKSNSNHATTVTLELSLSGLTQYEGNCTCEVFRTNKAGNVTMEATVEMSGCDSLSLHVEGWDYQASCDEEPAYDQTQFLDLSQIFSIFMNRRLGDSPPSIAGSITFKSLNQDKMALVCSDAIYVIPPSTTSRTRTTSLTTTTLAPSSLPTIVGVVGGSLLGIIIFLMTICLFMRYWKKKHKPNEDNQQEGISAQNGLANGRGEGHYEALDPCASVNPIYDVISSINNETK